MANKLFISDHNAIRFVPQNLPDNPAWNGVDPFWSWYINSFLINQVFRPYFIPVQRGENTVVIMKVSFDNPYLQIVDCSGNNVGDPINPYIDVIMTGDLDPDGDQYHSLVFRFNIWDITGADGTYYIRFPFDEKNNGFGEISEPIDLRRSHPNTVLIKYNNTTIKDGTQYIYDAHPDVYMYRRINGIVGNKKSSSDTTSYRGQGLSYYKPFDQNYRGLTASFGYFNNGIAEYDIDILGFIFSLDNVYVDRIQYARADGAELSKAFPDNYQNGSATIELVPVNEQQSTIRRKDLVLLVYTPDSEPYDLRTFTITDGTTPITYGTKTAVYSLEDRLVFLDVLNGQFALDNDIQGYFSFQGTSLYYINADGQSYNAATKTIWYNPLRLTVSAPFTNTFGFNYGSSASFDTVTYETGAKTITTYTGTSGSVAHTYTTGVVTAYMDIFSPASGGITSIDVPNSLQKLVANIGGYAPVGFISLRMATFFWPNANLNFLANCINTVTTLRFNSGNMVSLNTAVLLTATGNSLVAFQAIGNKLPSSNIDSIINNIAHSGTYGTPGDLQLQTQTPAAPPTAASATSRTTLTGASWTITTD